MKSAATAPGRSPSSNLAYSRAVDGALDALFGLNDGAATELLFVRHGEPAYSAAEKHGHDDPSLSERGRFQTIRLAMRMRRIDVEAVYTSTARAAIETATLVAASRDLPVVRAPQLRDIALHPAALNGSANDRRKLQAEVRVQLINRPRWDALRGVEPTRQFRHRIVQAIEAIAARHPGSRVVVVTHQPVINAYISMVLGIERDMFFQPEFTSISAVRILRDLYAVQSINDQAHLLPTFAPR